MGDRAADRREALEGANTWRRIVELRLRPVDGNFDVDHLKEINRRIFQDLPGMGFVDVTPGEFRSAVAAGNDWVKTRRLETVGVRSSVAYSLMDNAAKTRLSDILQAVNPAALARLDVTAFTQALGHLYSEIDYVHPFPDGNSRTLREFTRQLADAAGYKLDWDRFNQSPAGRDILYIARDLSVNRIAMPHVQHEGTKRDILLAMDQFEGNRDLPSLLRDAVEALTVAQSEHSSQAVEPSLEDQLSAQEGGSEHLMANEPSLEDQLAEQDDKAALSQYRVHLSPKVSAETESVDEPGMDI